MSHISQTFYLHLFLKSTFFYTFFLRDAHKKVKWHLARNSIILCIPRHLYHVNKMSTVYGNFTVDFIYFLDFSWIKMWKYEFNRHHIALMLKCGERSFFIQIQILGETYLMRPPFFLTKSIIHNSKKICRKIKIKLKTALQISEWYTAILIEIFRKNTLLMIRHRYILSNKFIFSFSNLNCMSYAQSI